MYNIVDFLFHVSKLGVIAGFFLHKAKSSKDFASPKITNKKLQKLVYYSQVWSVTALGKILFDEPIEAWVHGPAIRDLYLKYKPYGWNQIVISDEEDEEILKALKDLDSDVLSLLEEVWEKYGKYDAEYLEMLTHNEDPWINARSGLDVDQSSDIVITLDSIKSFYSKKLSNA